MSGWDGKGRSPMGEPNGHDLGPEFTSSLEEKSGVRPDVPMPVAEVTVMAPVFEVIIPSVLAGVDKPAYHFKIWGDGKIEGFDHLAAKTKKIAVVNRIPALLDQMFQPLREYVEDVNHAIDDLQGEHAATEDQAGVATGGASP